MVNVRQDCNYYAQNVELQSKATAWRHFDYTCNIIYIPPIEASVQSPGRTDQKESKKSPKRDYT
jgi:hypothetical protein